MSFKKLQISNLPLFADGRNVFWKQIQIMTTRLKNKEETRRVGIGGIESELKRGKSVSSSNSSLGCRGRNSQCRCRGGAISAWLRWRREPRRSPHGRRPSGSGQTQLHGTLAGTGTRNTYRNTCVVVEHATMPPPLRDFADRDFLEGGEY